MAPGGFAFTKWYFDCLDREGRLAICYWTLLQWRRLRIAWSGVTLCAPGERARTRSSVVPCPGPVTAGALTQWSCRRLRCDVELSGGTGPMASQQLASGLVWSCVAPAANAIVRGDDTRMHGTGYAERIELSVPPWQLGIERLRWGRWIGDGATRSVVWIEWNDSPQQRWVFLDGTRVAAAGVSEDTVSAGAATLHLGDPTVMIDRRLGATVRKVPALRAVAPRWLLAGHEQRRTRTGTLRDGAAVTHGTIVDELVDFG